MKSNIARVLLNAKDEDKKKLLTLPPSCQFEPSVMVDMFPGPALLVDGDMVVKYHNVFAKSLLGPIDEKEAHLKAMISRCLTNVCPDTQKATLKESDGLRHYDLYAFPLKQEQADDAPLVFLFGRETTIEYNLTNALVESRQMFKDLVSCSTDFAWETDCSGNFIYVSPKGILGYTAYELNGKNSREMIIGGEERNPFDTMNKVNEMELWLKRADGSMACLLVSAVPILDNQAKWQGARGVCRDITHIREREAVLRRTHKREHILNKIVSSIRDMVTPTDMLENALNATMEGIASDSSCIIQKTNLADGNFKAEVKQQQGNISDTDLIYTLCQKAMSLWSDPQAVPSKTGIMQIKNYQILFGITNHHSEDNGVIVLIRNMGTEWNEDEIQLFNGITNHLGIALEQVITHEELQKRAFTDEMTNLLNRRAFAQEIKKRIQNQKRSRMDGALLYIDLDNFKNVNDTRGHAHGDMILKELAHIIRENTRVGDYSARLGGDEFAIWLDEIPRGNIHLKAYNFIVAGARLARLADVDGPQISISIGVALSDPNAEQTYDELMEKADKALYQAKNNGKANCVMFGADGREFKDKTDEEYDSESYPDA